MYKGINALYWPSIINYQPVTQYTTSSSRNAQLSQLDLVKFNGLNIVIIIIIIISSSDQILFQLLIGVNILSFCCNLNLFRCNWTFSICCRNWPLFVIGTLKWYIFRFCNSEVKLWIYDSELTAEASAIAFQALPWSNFSLKMPQSFFNEKTIWFMSYCLESHHHLHHHQHHHRRHLHHFHCQIITIIIFIITIIINGAVWSPVLRWRLWYYAPLVPRLCYPLYSCNITLDNESSRKYLFARRLNMEKTFFANPIIAA